MPTPARGPRLGGSPAHERLMLANLATSLFEHGRITTTVTKAKRLRPLAERLVTFAKRGDLHARRQVMTVVRDKTVVHHLFTEIGPRYANRPGGYTRITKLGPRHGDNAPMATIELVEALTVAQEAVGEAERARGTRFARSATAEALPEAPEELEGSAEDGPEDKAEDGPEDKAEDGPEDKAEGGPEDKAEGRPEDKAEDDGETTEAEPATDVAEVAGTPEAPEAPEASAPAEDQDDADGDTEETSD